MHAGMIEVLYIRTFSNSKQSCYGATVWILQQILIVVVNVCMHVYLVIKE